MGTDVIYYQHHCMYILKDRLCKVVIRWSTCCIYTLCTWKHTVRMISEDFTLISLRLSIIILSYFNLHFKAYLYTYIFITETFVRSSITQSIHFYILSSTQTTYIHLPQGWECQDILPGPDEAAGCGSGRCGPVFPESSYVDPCLLEANETASRHRLCRVSWVTVKLRGQDSS